MENFELDFELEVRNCVGDQLRISCQEGSKFSMYNEPLKKRSRENNHQQLLLSCLTFKKPLTESTINYFFEFEQICFVTCFYC